MKFISLQLLVDAASRGQIAVPGELAGFLVLLLLDELQGRSEDAALGEVRLLEEGRVLFAPDEGEKRADCRLSPRQLLGRMLAVSSSVSPGLRRVSCGATVGIQELTKEFETALIPLNRGAARRGLARLYRELSRHLAPAVLSERPVLAVLSQQDVPVSPPIVRGVAELYGEAEVEVEASCSCQVPPTAEPSRIPDLELPEQWVSEQSAIGHRQPSSALRRFVSLSSVEPPLSEVTEEAADSELLSVCTVESIADAYAVEELRTITLVIAPVEPITVTKAPVAECVAVSPIVIEPEPSLVTEDEPRAVTLVIAPVEPIAVAKAPVTDCAAVSPIIMEQEPSLVVTEDEPRAVTLVMAEVRPNAEPIELMEPSIALPLVTLRHRQELPETVAATAWELGWDQTSVDTVIEVSDDEVMFDDAVMLDAEVMLDADDAEVMLDAEVIDSSACERSLASELGNTSCLDEDYSLDMTVIPLGAHDLWYVKGTDVSVVDEGELAGCGVPEATVAAGHPTLYRIVEIESAPPRSDPSALAAILDEGSYWEEPELCRGLRSLAGLELTPQPQVVETLTPPPIVGQVVTEVPLGDRRNSVQLLLGFGAAALFAALTLGYSSRNSVLSSAVATQGAKVTERGVMLPIERLCHATLNVEGVGFGAIIRARQRGDERYREPTRSTEVAAVFAGLRCSESVELIVQEPVSLILERIPVAADHLRPVRGRSSVMAAVTL